MLASKKENGKRLNSDPNIRKKMIEGRIRNCIARAKQRYGFVDEESYNTCRYHSTPSWYSGKYVEVFEEVLEALEVT